MATLPPSQCGLQRSASQELVDAIRDRERQRLALELHDTVIQPLMALFTSIEYIHFAKVLPESCDAYIHDWRELVREAIDSLRGTVAGLHGHPHAKVGLPEALRRYL